MGQENSIISSTYALSTTLEQEAKRAAARAGEAYAANTRRAYAASWRIFEVWCSEKGGAAAKATPEIVATYLESRLSGGLGARACVREYSALAVFLREIQPDGPWKPRSPPEIIRRWLKGAIRRARPIVKKEPLLPEHFILLAAKPFEPGAKWIEGARDRALLLLGFAGGFRRSELVALDVADVELTSEGAVLHIRRSKTDQASKGAVIAVWRQDSRHCPVAALETYLRGARITEGPVFRKVSRCRLLDRRLSDRAVAIIVKRAVVSLGLDPRKYAGHSLRCGFVTAAATRGASIDEIMNTTRHKKADQVISYIRRTTPFERNASKGLLEDTKIACGRGHEHNQGGIGKYCTVGVCGETAGDRSPLRRIECRMAK